MSNSTAPLANPRPLQPAPVEYAGQWVAWNKDRTAILSHGANVAEVRKAAVAAGEPLPVLQKVSRPDQIFEGSI